MAYDRYDTRDGPRERSSRWSDDRQDRMSSRGRDERGFFERAGDQIASWFGDDEDRGPRMHDHRGHDHRDHDHRGREQGRFFGRDEGDDQGSFWRDRSWDRDDFERGEGRRSEPRGGGWRQREFGRERHRDDDYRPMTGDYGRSERGMDRQSFSRDRDERSTYQRSQSPWGRDEMRRTSFAGSSERSRDFDPHYHDWRQRQVESLDRDYDDYRRERQTRFEDDFSSWREQRQSKRQMLGQVREHMEVVGNDGKHVGTIDRVAGDRLILTKSDPESGGVHHSLSCAEIDKVEDNRVLLNCSSTEAHVRWRDESRGRALFEREDQGESGPRILDRSFEGTYR